MQFSKLSSESDVKFIWPTGDREPYSQIDHYEVIDGERPIELAIMYGWREAFERNRRRVMVCIAKPLWPLIELVGTETYDQDKTMLWSLKKPGGNKHYESRDDPRDHFPGIRLVIHKDYIQGKGARSGWAAMVAETDVELMLRLGLIRGRDRGWI